MSVWFSRQKLFLLSSRVGSCSTRQSIGGPTAAVETGALVKLAAFLSSLSWPSEVIDLGPCGVSYVELLILYERWAGERKGFGLRSLSLNIEGLDVQFQCQLHPCALILIFGSFAGSLVICLGLWLGFLVDWGGSFLVGLELIIAG